MNAMGWLLLGLAIVLLAGGGTIVYEATRGLRNNNPGNIRLDGTNWQGMSPTQTDPSFVQFVSPEYGLRAIAVILNTYMNNYGLNTVTGIISRWAPPTENDTAAYIADVANQMGVDPNQPLSQAQIPSLVAAIVHHENGLQPYTTAQIDQAVALA